MFLFNGFLVSSVLLRFVYPAVSPEGQAFWTVRAAPVSLTRLYLYKLVVRTADGRYSSEALGKLAMAK